MPAVSAVTTVTQPNVVVVQQQQNNKPNNYMTMAVLTLFLCGSPFAIVAWIFSCLSDSAYEEGDIHGARHKGKVSMWLSVTGIICNTLLIIIIPAVIVTSAVKAAADFGSNSCTWGETYGKNYYNKWDCYSCAKCVYYYMSTWDKNHCRMTC